MNAGRGLAFPEFCAYKPAHGRTAGSLQARYPSPSFDLIPFDLKLSAAGRRAPQFNGAVTAIYLERLKWQSRKAKPRA